MRAFFSTEQRPRSASTMTPARCPSTRREQGRASPTDEAGTIVPEIRRGAWSESGTAPPNERSGAGTAALPVMVDERAKKRDELVAATVIAFCAAPGESIEP